VQAATKRDAFSGGTWIQVAVINEKGIRFLSREEVADVLKK